jgi:hypothetical protein
VSVNATSSNSVNAPVVQLPTIAGASETKSSVPNNQSAPVNSPPVGAVQNVSFQSKASAEPMLPLDPTPPQSLPSPKPNPEMVPSPESLGPPKLTLDQAIQECLVSDPQIRAGQEAINQARADLMTGSLLPNPQVTVDGIFLPARPFTAQQPGGPPQNDVNINYPVDWFLFGKRAAGITAAQRGVDVSNADFADLVRQRVNGAIQAFFDVLQAQALLEISRQNLANFQRVEAITQNRVNLGGIGAVELDRVLMFKGITNYRLQGASIDDAIIHGRIDRLRPVLMTSLVAIMGLLPASLATGLGSDVQRPLATVIIWGLAGSTVFTQFITPVFYRIFVPPLQGQRRSTAASEAEPRSFGEPVTDVSASEVVGLLEHLHSHGSEANLFQVADDTNRQFARVIEIVKAAEMLRFVDTPGEVVALTAKGKQFATADPDERKALWREQLLNLGLFRKIYDILGREPTHAIDSDFVLETIVTRMPFENYEKVFNTFVRWARFGELFRFDEEAQRISLS